ncbi:MAG: tyrosine-protein phosphatase [Acholeplasmatales bacterium]|nr:tyrosine-protein phosphatase [Acholeplasmatales bacterium]
MLKLKKVKNYRDLSYLNNDKINIKPNLLIRSGHLHKLNKRSMQALNANNILVLDLRSNQEILEKPDKYKDELNYLNIPVFDLSVYGVTREHKSIKDALFKAKTVEEIKNNIPKLEHIYASVIKEEIPRNNLKDIVNLIIDNVINGKGVLYHCTAGKDRTGMVSVILLKILGFDNDAVINDYLKTNIRAIREKRKYYLGVLLLKRSKSLAKMIAEMMLAKEEYIRSFINAIDQLYGDFNSFIKIGLGIDDDILFKFKGALIS